MPIESTMTTQEKVISLYKFVKELNALKRKTVLNVKDYQWSKSVSLFPDDPENIKINFRDRVDEEDEVSDVLLSVHKPEFEECPEPDPSIRLWIEPGWKNFRSPLAFKEYRVFNNRNDELSGIELERVLSAAKEYDVALEHGYTIRKFADDENRAKIFSNWKSERDNWAKRQRVLNETRNLFMELYRQYVDLQRDTETLEIIVANGFIRDRDNPDIDQAVLTRRVNMNYDANENTISIVDADVDTDLYSNLFQEIDGINLDKLGELREDLIVNDYHPLDSNETPNYLRKMIHYFSSESIFSGDGIPADWEEEQRFLMYINPTYIVRNRVDGTLRAIEQILNNIELTGYIPKPICEIVAGGIVEVPPEREEISVEEQLAAVGGESIDILLSKEANKEQLQIAQRIEQYNAVLVQGPPGTGKTHTIANLLGHFLAQGKSVLVTSHTKKALSVLKEKVAPGLQSLCVSVLDDSNVDMEKSIDGITDYMSKYTSFALKDTMDKRAKERERVISQLASVRKKIFSLINQECNSIVINGEEISPSKAASFVLDNADELAYIPGSVRAWSALPLSFEELSDLYRSNDGINKEDEKELACNLPSPEDLLTPEYFEEICTELNNAESRLDKISNEKSWKITNDLANETISVKFDNLKVKTIYPDKGALSSLEDYVSNFKSIESWMLSAAVDGKKGGNYRQKWLLLVDKISEACAFSDSLAMETFGHDIVLSEEFDYLNYQDEFFKLRDSGGKTSKLNRKFNKKLDEALKSILFDGHEVSSIDECNTVIHLIQLGEIRNKLSKYWRDLFSEYDVAPFFELSPKDPEHVAQRLVGSINRYIDWYDNEYGELINLLSAANIPGKSIFPEEALMTDEEYVKNILLRVKDILPPLCDAIRAALDIQSATQKLEATKAILMKNQRVDSPICMALLGALFGRETCIYSEKYKELIAIYSKYDLQLKREDLLAKLRPVAPQWADAIRDRVGIHGSNSVPDNIEDAWKWKQLSSIIDSITKQPFEELQAESLRLGKEYRRITAEYAECSAWYHLIKRTEANLSMKQALQGWKQTVKAIGKGTGKRAPQLKAEARKLMAQCQEAVPAWIMPINRALESLDPQINSFDVVIVDEASQSDISSLAILYMGKKLIIVGDDKQVSPMAIGQDANKITALQNEYIKNKIPNAHLYDGKRSIYDVAMTTFQPLMLKEHFRCVPEIIGFSNGLSYDFKIKPMRDGGNNKLVPAVVNYRVQSGRRSLTGKTNEKEALTIIMLMKACMEQPEYTGKTFGIISMLGTEQVKMIESLLFQYVDPREIELRNITCGISSNFQGDQRDVVFLSMVDSNEIGSGPLNKVEFGPDDSYRKRYNVATSRAKDQLWVVDSLDAANDLKPGDIRRRLIEYSINPKAQEEIVREIEADSESPFEESVAKELLSHGFHLAQQLQVGGYRLDMVATCKNKKVAIECDGERFHSGEDKIREDMERQAILERIGWHFIRIRGSEYYSDPKGTIERVVRDLGKYGIEPEGVLPAVDESRETELLSRIKQRAGELIEKADECSEDVIPDYETIGAALRSDNVEKSPTDYHLIQKRSTSEKASVTQPAEIPDIKKAKDSVAVRHESPFPSVGKEASISISVSSSGKQENKPQNTDPQSVFEAMLRGSIKVTDIGNSGKTNHQNEVTNKFQSILDAANKNKGE